MSWQFADKVLDELHDIRRVHCLLHHCESILLNALIIRVEKVDHCLSLGRIDLNRLLPKLTLLHKSHQGIQAKES